MTASEKDIEMMMNYPDLFSELQSIYFVATHGNTVEYAAVFVTGNVTKDDVSLAGIINRNHVVFTFFFLTNTY